MRRREFILLSTSLLLTARKLPAEHLAISAGSPVAVRYDGADWRLKGDGVVSCPCAVPCPCRYNAPPSYGHCEATLYLRIMEGYYGTVRLDGMQMIEVGGMCATKHRPISALYFDHSSSAAQRSALMKLIASLSPESTAYFPHVRAVRIEARVTADRLFNVSIPGILEMIVDRNWGQSSPPMPWVAAPDTLSNEIQYAENIQYRVHDIEAGLKFDYSHRQANYRIVNLSVDQYRSKDMLIQFQDEKGWFNFHQLELIKAQHLAVPQLEVIQKEAKRLREASAP